MRLLEKVIAGLSVVAILGDAGVPDLLDQANKEAAEAEGLRPVNIRLRGAQEDIEAVFARIREQHAGASPSYGSSLSDATRRMAGMVDLILKGSKAGELAIQVVTNHRLTANLPLAREIGATIPRDRLTRADKVLD